MNKESFVYWNSKGGVGKTTSLNKDSILFAENNPNSQVIVIDLCPQANISQMLIGNENLNEMINTLEDKRYTIGGYFDERLSNPTNIPELDYEKFLIKVQDFNFNLPSNLYLVVGDPSLELQVRAINQELAVSLPEDRWFKIHKWIIDLEEEILKHLPNSVFFIDTNPSFATYTLQGLLAATNLIIPCSPDYSSVRAIENVGRLLYGVNLPSRYKGVDTTVKLKKFNMELPKLDKVIFNMFNEEDNDHLVIKNLLIEKFNSLLLETRK